MTSSENSGATVMAMDLIHLIKFYLHVYHKWHKLRSADSTTSYFRIIRRLNLIVNQPFLYIYIYIYICVYDNIQ
jgi:hypothetical protein